MKPIYINANLIYGECLKLISKNNWNRTIKTGILDKLAEKEYDFTTSILTKTEIIQRLMREESITSSKARKIYLYITNKYNILQIESLNKKNLLTNYFMDIVAKSNLDFKDALHLDIASKQKLTVVTHDKKFYQNYSKHKDKLKFYSKVVKPQELL